jgi:hypothetical protein
MFGQPHIYLDLYCYYNTPPVPDWVTTFSRLVLSTCVLSSPLVLHFQIDRSLASVSSLTYGGEGQTEITDKQLDLGGS